MNKEFIQGLLENIEKSQAEVLELNSKILIIDGLNTFLRNFTMVNLLNSTGNHIGGLVGFLKSIGYVIKLIQPTRVIIVFDGPGGSDSKKNLYPDYKGNRHINRVTNYEIFSTKEEEDESIRNQMERLVQYLQLLPIDLICIDGLEADDVIGYLNNKFEANNLTKEITIVSMDRDFLQKVSPKTKVYSPVKKKFYGMEEVLEEFEVHANNFLIYKALLGDSSDNLPGIPGFKEKRILKHFPELGKEEELDLEKVLEICRLSESKSEYYSKVIERKTQIEINYRLMNLKSLVISPENIELIESILLNDSKRLDKHQFLLTYFSDTLGNSIPNTITWIDTVFKPLQNFR